MKLYERFGERGYHTSLITSFGLDFDAYENVVLPRLRGAGCHNNILLCDGALLTQSLADSSSLPRYAGRLYTANGAKAAGVFHPKLFVQLGRNGGRIIVSSANMTASGLAGNLELAGEFACGTEDSGEQRLVAQAWTYALRHCDRTGQALDVQIAWAEARTPWLRHAVQTREPVELEDKTTASLLTTGERTGIGERFVAHIDDMPVKRLVIVSPYWDGTLKALGFIARTLSPAKTDLLIDSAAGLFPVTALKKLKDLRLFDREEFCKGRFLHAKAVIAQTRKADHILYGSANCTIAALGTKGFAGENEEVCMYRRFPAGTVLDSLELTELLDPSREVDPDKLEESENEDELDLEAWAMDRGENFDADVDDKSPEEKLREEQRRKTAQRKATRGQIADAVSAFNEQISERRPGDALTTFDVLRLRALLMIVAAAGWAGRETDAEGSRGRTSLQVLPVQDGAESWPRLMGQVLFGFFGGNDPAIRHVRIDALHEQFTDDILESWATCFWCLHACLGAPCSKEEHAALERYILALAEKLYRLTGFKEDELLTPDIKLVMERMSERFSGRLGLDSVALRKGHASFVKSIFEKRPSHA
jgi:hypothetical protein